MYKNVFNLIYIRTIMLLTFQYFSKLFQIVNKTVIFSKPLNTLIEHISKINQFSCKKYISRNYGKHMNGSHPLHRLLNCVDCYYRLCPKYTQMQIMLPKNHLKPRTYFVVFVAAIGQIFGAFFSFKSLIYVISDRFMLYKKILFTSRRI